MNDLKILENFVEKCSFIEKNTQWIAVQHAPRKESEAI